MNSDAHEDLISVRRAVQIIRDGMPRLQSEKLALRDAVGRILANDIDAGRHQPPFDRVMMDGIAMRFADWDRGARAFGVIGVQAAGQPALALSQENTCVEVMTGAVLPAGSDCVVPIEDFERNGATVQLSDGARVEPRGFIHAEGSDYSAGSRLLAAGHVVDGPATAVLASEGYGRVSVVAQPSICIIATGDELVCDTTNPLPHQIRSSNAFALAASLKLFGWGDARVLHLPDKQEALKTGLLAALDAHDVLVLSGGVSRGRFDFVPGVLEASNVTAQFHGIRQRPGKPMWFGTNAKGNKVVFALPGNPVSAIVCLHRHVLPALAQSGGNEARPIRVNLASELTFRPPLTWFVPVNLVNNDLGNDLLAKPVLTNTSGDFSSLAHTSGFIELPDTEGVFEKGFSARYFSWRP